MKSIHRRSLLIAAFSVIAAAATLAGAKFPTASAEAQPAAVSISEAAPFSEADPGAPTPSGATECDQNGASWWNGCGCRGDRYYRQYCECVSHKVKCGPCVRTGFICE